MDSTASTYSELSDKTTVNALPFYDGPDFTPVWDSDRKDTLHRVADFNFTNQYGEIVNQQSVNDKIYVVNFFFTTCGSICPRMMTNMQKVQDRYQDNQQVVLISHTVMPWIDSVSVLKNYGDSYHAQKNKWHLVTGNKSDLYSLARTSYFVEEEPGFTKDSTEFLHTEHVILVDRQRHIRGLYNGTLELEMERLMDDINLLIQEN